MEDNKKTCIECGKNFEVYQHEVVCHICDGEGIIEVDDNFMHSDYRTCWQCNGQETITINEIAFCDEDCREEYFDKQE